MTDSDPIALCLAGRISPPVMLARLVLAGATSATIRQTLAACSEAAELLAFLAPREAAIDRMHAMLARVNHATGADVARIAAQFDTAVAADPAASVAAYSLGDPALLEQATAEVVAWLADQHLFLDNMDVLDLGCGFGRIAAALAPRARSVLGLDISPRMIEEARRCHGTLRGLGFAVTEGRDLGCLPDASRDLILAVDCFPYLFQAGVAEAHIRDAARVLRPGGALAVLNLSYAADPAPDRARALDWAADAGLVLEQDGVTPFTLWDAAAFVFRRG
jgi:SAM-dependent methyltransferase